MLEIWEARRLDHVLTSGRTKPVVLECVLPDRSQDNLRLMVVKALGPREVTETGLMCELMGNLLAKELAVCAPEGALVNISAQMADSIRPYLSPPGFMAGFAVGSEYLRTGLTAVIPDMTLSPEEREQAARLYAFDLLTQNPDRRCDNPNCGFIGQHIFAYDFELCFSFLRALSDGSQPWEVSQHGIGVHHIFHGALRKQLVDWQPFVENVARLTEETLEQITARLPLSWQEKTSRIYAHLLSVAAHPKEFAMELERSIL